MTIAFLAIYWSGMAAPHDSFYWLAGSIEYVLTLALIILIFCAANYLSRAGNSAAARWAGVTGLSAATLATTGLHELAAAVLLALLGSGAMVAIYLRNGRWKLWLLLGSVAFIGLLFTALAPGNLARADLFQDSRSLAATIGMVRWRVEHLIIPWIFDVKILTASLFLVTAPWLKQLQPDWAKANVGLWRWGIPCLSVLLLLGLSIGPAWIMGSTGSGRTHNFVYAIFLLSWFATLAVWAPALAADGRSAMADRLHAVSAILFAGSLLFAPNTLKALDDLTGRTSVWDWYSEMTRRHDRLSEATGTEAIELTPLKVRSLVLDYPAIGTEADDPHNQCIGRYFRIQRVILAPP